METGGAVDVKEWTIDERVHSAGQKKEEEGRVYLWGCGSLYLDLSCDRSEDH